MRDITWPLTPFTASSIRLDRSSMRYGLCSTSTSSVSEAFFKERLSDVDSVTELAPDLTNPRPQGENGRVWAPLVWKDAERLAKAQGVNPSAVLLSAVFYSLSRFSGSDDVCITTISNGRSNLKVSNTMGMFVNTLALRAKIGGQTVKEFLHESSVTFEQTLAHEDYPFARIAADYGLKADIMFAYQIGVLSEYSVGGKQVLADETMELNVPKFKIAFYITEVEGKPSVAIEFDNGQYSEDMMKSLAQSVVKAVSAFAADVDSPLRNVSLLDSKQEGLLDSFNSTDVDYDKTQTIVSLFRAQAAETPDNLAVVYHDVRLTYKEVDEKTDALAAKIRKIAGRRFDIAFVVLDPRQGEMGGKGMDLFLSEVGARYVFPMHLWGRYDLIVDYKSKNQLKYVTSQIMDIRYPGQTFELVL